jgi:hypothetical protein
MSTGGIPKNFKVFDDTNSTIWPSIPTQKRSLFWRAKSWLILISSVSELGVGFLPKALICHLGSGGIGPASVQMTLDKI